METETILINHCSIMQGIILDKLISEKTSKKISPFEILQPGGGYMGNIMDRVSRYSRKELEILLGQKYKTGDAIELADLLIYKLIKEIKNEVNSLK